MTFLTTNAHRAYPLVSTPDGLPNGVLLDALLFLPTGHPGVYLVQVDQCSGSLLLAFNAVGTGLPVFWVVTNVEDYPKHVQLESFLPDAAGVVLLGQKNWIPEADFYIGIQEDQGLLEPSRMVFKSGMPVRSIRVGDEKISGDVGFRFNGVELASNPLQLQLPEALASEIQLPGGICHFQPILSVNGVSPDDYGDLTVVAMPPLQLGVTTGRVTLEGGSLVLADLCTQAKKKPPINPSHLYGDIDSATVEEWRTWP